MILTHETRHDATRNHTRHDSKRVRKTIRDIDNKRHDTTDRHNTKHITHDAKSGKRERVIEN